MSQEIETSPVGNPRDGAMSKGISLSTQHAAKCACLYQTAVCRVSPV